MTPLYCGQTDRQTDRHAVNNLSKTSEHFIILMSNIYQTCNTIVDSNICQAYVNIFLTICQQSINHMSTTSHQSVKRFSKIRQQSIKDLSNNYHQSINNLSPICVKICQTSVINMSKIRPQNVPNKLIADVGKL